MVKQYGYTYFSQSIKFQIYPSWSHRIAWPFDVCGNSDRWSLPYVVVVRRRWNVWPQRRSNKPGENDRITIYRWKCLERWEDFVGKQMGERCVFLCFFLSWWFWYKGELWSNMMISYNEIMISRSTQFDCVWRQVDKITISTWFFRFMEGHYTK